MHTHYGDNVLLYQANMEWRPEWYGETFYYDDDCDYFYQCGDDIEFMDPNWVKICIDKLISFNDKGVTGPIDWGREVYNMQNGGRCKFLLTQTSF